MLEEGEGSVARRDQRKTDGGDEETGGNGDYVSCSSKRTENDSHGGKERIR